MHDGSLIKITDPVHEALKNYIQVLAQDKLTWIPCYKNSQAGLWAAALVA